MNIVEFFNKNRKDIVIILVTVLITWFFSGISFKHWQRKVAKEALENVKLEQAFCDRAILIVNEKIDEFRNNGENTKGKVTLEYFDNIKNQMASLKEIINRSKLTWANIFPEEAKETEKFDKQLIVSIKGIKSLEDSIKFFKKQQETAVLDKNKLIEQNKKIQMAITELGGKINRIKNQINNFQSTNLVYPSNFLSSSDNIILPNGNIFNFDNVSINQLTPLFQQSITAGNLPLNNFQSTNLVYPSNFLSSSDNFTLPNGNIFKLDDTFTGRPISSFQSHVSIDSLPLLSNATPSFNNNTPANLDFLKPGEGRNMFRFNNGSVSSFKIEDTKAEDSPESGSP